MNNFRILKINVFIDKNIYATKNYIINTSTS